MPKTELHWAEAYIASPFFSPEENFIVERIEQSCEGNGVKPLSPRKFMVLQPKASFLERQEVFEDNIENLRCCDVVLANVAGYDAGTLWEMGFAYAIGKPVVAFHFGGKKMNVMLACGTKGFLENLEELGNFLKGHQTGQEETDLGKLWDFNWGVPSKWFQNIC